MECFLANYGEYDPRSAMAMYNYAVSLTMMHAFTEAQAIANRAYSAMREIHGSERTETLQSQYLVARILWNLHQRRQAVTTANNCCSTLLKKGMHPCKTVTQIVHISLQSRNLLIMGSLPVMCCACFWK